MAVEISNRAINKVGNARSITLPKAYYRGLNGADAVICIWNSDVLLVIPSDLNLALDKRKALEKLIA